MTVTEETSKTGPNFPKSWSEQYVQVISGYQQIFTVPGIDVHAIRGILASLPPPPAAEDITIEEIKIPRVPAPGLEEAPTGEIEAEWETSAACNDDSPVLLFWHGGGYVIMSKESHRPLTTQIARAGVKVLSINYRMGPEDVYPAAVVDAYSTYKYALSLGIPASKIVFGGDSAGGGLTYATSLYLRDQGEQQPAGLILLTPWVDLSLSAPSVNLGGEFESCSLSRGALNLMATGYGKGIYDEVKKNPYFSPIHADVKADAPLPPQLITTGTHDRLLSEDIAVTLKRTKGGENVQLEVYEDQPHDFQLIGIPKQVSFAVQRKVEFIRAVTSGKKIQTQYLFVNDHDLSVDSHSRQEMVARLSALLKRQRQENASEEGDDVSPYEEIVAAEKV